MPLYKIEFTGIKADTVEILQNIGTKKTVLTIHKLKENRVDTIFSLPEEYENVENVGLFLSEKIREE